MSQDKVRSLGRELKNQVAILGGLVLVFWTVEILDSILFRGWLGQNFGIVPHRIDRLPGILAAPFLHGNFAHVAANTPPFIVLGWLVMLRGIDEFWFVSIVSALVSGMGVWVFSPTYTVTVGVSGVIFGYLGFLLWRGYFERSFLALAIAIGTGLIYGGVVWGILPGRVGISWQAHLFGFLGGALAARLLADRNSKRRDEL